MEYRRVELDDGTVRYVPVPDDPLATLRESASDELREASIAELQTAVLEEARSQALAEMYQRERWSEKEES